MHVSIYWSCLVGGQRVEYGEKACYQEIEISTYSIVTAEKVSSIFKPGPVAWSNVSLEVAGSILWSGNTILWRLVMKSFLRPFSRYR